MTNPSEIEREIEEARDRLANTIDQLVYRSSPKTVVGREVAAVKAHYVDAQGQPRTDNILKTVGGVVGVIAAFVVIRKLVR
ncbi:DUF3618 domain-containing protein [Nocardioides ultimimeridianus]